MKKILTIAGSDCSGGAGIQADIKTITAHNHYAMSAITALTAQNTTGVYGVCEVNPDFVGQQLDCIFQDIFPDAVKIGMVSSPEIIKVIVSKLKEYKAKNIVIDPVMISTSGHSLINDEAKKELIENLMPLGILVTPNISETEALCGFSVNTQADMVLAAEAIGKRTDGAVLVKGGHHPENADDLLYDHGKITWFRSEKVDNPNTHGTGCTLSSAIASNLGAGMDLESSIREAKNYITGALKAQLDLGAGSGPLNHSFLWQ